MLSGPVPIAPLNKFAMLTDYIEPEERLVACPNQDVVYGAGSLALDLSPVVVQVPDFGDRFWVYQMVDLRTDSFVQLGKMYGTRPGFYLLVGPTWRGEVPKGITKVFRVADQYRLRRAARVPGRHARGQARDPERAAADHDVSAGRIRRQDEKHRLEQDEEDPGAAPPGTPKSKWVFPEKFFDELPAILSDAPPLPGEEARYAQMRALIEAIKANPALKPALIKAVRRSKTRSSRRCSSSATGASSFRTTGARSRTKRPSAPTTSPARRQPSPTSWSTRRTRRSTSIRTSTRAARGSTAPTATPSPSRKTARRR